MRDITQPRKKKHYPQFSVRVADALTLQQRIAAGEATPLDEHAYQRIINAYRRKYRNGALSAQLARQFGIE
jgi:hypothetical protein